jgi:hypothetical protein
MAPRLNGDDFRAAGPRYLSAWQTLLDGCEVPPSFEVFQHEFKRLQDKAPGLSPEGMARRLSESYHRTAGLFGTGEY